MDVWVGWKDGWGEKGGGEEEAFHDVLPVMMRESERKGVSFAFNFAKMRGD